MDSQQMFRRFIALRKQWDARVQREAADAADILAANPGMKRDEALRRAAAVADRWEADR